MTGIKLNEGNEFTIRLGDFVIMDTDLQDEKEILYANKGNFLAEPTLGVGIADFSHSPMSKPTLERLIRKEFEKDGINVVRVTVNQTTADKFDITLSTNRNEQ